TGDTSEFSGACEVLDVVGTDFIVTNIDDGGTGSLRQAIVDANANPGHDTITFCIPGAGVHTITPLAPGLPTITDPVTIDGYTQEGASPNTNGPSQGDNAVLLIEISGAGPASQGAGIVIGVQAAGSP